MLLWSVARKCSSSQVSSCVVCGTRDVQRVGCGMVWETRARRVPRNVTVHRLSAYSQDLFVVHSPSPRQPSVSSQKKVAHVIHELTASHLVSSCSCCTHTTARVLRANVIFPLKNQQPILGSHGFSEEK